MSVPVLDEDLLVKNVLVLTDFSAQSYKALLSGKNFSIYV
jgi:hypothetical protein